MSRQFIIWGIVGILAVVSPMLGSRAELSTDGGGTGGCAVLIVDPAPIPPYSK